MRFCVGRGVIFKPMQIYDGWREGESMLEDNSKNSVSSKYHICTCCRRIVNAEGVWEESESYFLNNPGASISSVVCLNCLQKNFPYEYETLFPEMKMK